MNTNLLLSPVLARPWRTLLKSLSACCIGLSLLSSNLYAASVNDVEVNRHCTDCKVLVGAAQIDFGGIRWNSDDTVESLELDTSPSEFGFTGCSSSLSDSGCQNGAWVSTTPWAVRLEKPRRGNNINLYVAPQVASNIPLVLYYFTRGPSSEKLFTVNDKGISDEENNPIITLDTTVEVQGIDRTDKSKQEQVVVVPLYGKVRFTVTPRVCSEGDCGSAYDKLLRDAGLQPIEYVYINLTVTEHNTGCLGRSSISFQDQGSRENYFAQGSSYYHYLRGPVFTECGGVVQDRSYAFLVSVDKQFYFDAINLRDTGTGHVDYVFYVNGHYDPANPDESEKKYVSCEERICKGSWKKFQLTSKSQLTVAKTGEGIISATGSNCSATECTGIYNAGVQVVLTATPATGFKFVNWTEDCNGTDSSVTVIMDKDKLCKARFEQQTFALTVTKNDNGQVSDSGNYAAGVPVNLFAESYTGYQFESWSPAPCASSFVMPAGDLTCTAKFVQQTFDLAVTTSGHGQVSVSGNYVVGTTVNLAATPDAGYQFESWSPLCANSFVMPAQNLTCTATFIKKCATDDDSCQIMGPLNILNSPNFFPTTYPDAHFAGRVSIGNSILDTKTTGRITLRGDDFTNPKSEKMVIRANITVAPDDVEKAATTGIDILVVVNYTFYAADGKPHNIWYMLEENNLPLSPSSLLSYPFFGKEWNGELSKDELVAFSRIIDVNKLPGTEPYEYGFEIVSVNLPFYYYMIGTYDIYVGYRLANEGKIIYGPKPIQFKIE